MSQDALAGWRNKLFESTEDRYPTFSWVARRNRTRRELRVAPSFGNILQHNDWYERVKNAIDDYDKWFEGTKYYKDDFDKAPAIVITETPIAGQYMSYTRHPFGLVSLAYWRAFFKPGSALEYMLNNVQRLSLRLCYGSVGSHFPTRGCIWDFDVHQPDIRISASLGLLCDTCRKKLHTAAGEAEFEQVERLIGNEWIGKKDDPFSVAAFLAKNYSYELRRTTGLSPGFASSINQGLKTEAGKFFLDILKVVLIAVITLIVASYFPNIYKIFKGESSPPAASDRTRP